MFIVRISCINMISEHVYALIYHNVETDGSEMKHTKIGDRPISN